MRYLTLSLTLCLFTVLCGCANGPTHDYYSPVTVVEKQRFKGPPTLSLVEDVKAEKEKRLQDGFTLIGTTDYTGKYPEASELHAQAKRAHANVVIYSVRDVSKPGDWHFSFGNWGGSGGTSGRNEVHIVFMGK